MKGFGLFLTLCLLAVPVALWWFVQRPLPALDGAISVAHLSEGVIVKFDAKGVPYIEARNEQDLYLAQGYITARDRMFQMDMLRRLALGEMSEVFGVSALPYDKLMRTLGLGRASEAELNLVSPPVRNCLEAYARGVNAYLDSSRGKLPVEFSLLAYSPKSWTARDTVALMKHLSYQLDESWQLDDLRQRVLDKAGPKVASELFGEDWSALKNASLPRPFPDRFLSLLARVYRPLPPPSPLWGSSGWVIAAKGSSGGALLACDKHTALTIPDLFYLSSLTTPSLRVAGATIPGVPGILVGRNRDIAFAGVALKADVQDLFLEKFDEKFPDKYKDEKGWLSAREVIETIPVRFAKDYLHKVSVTRHGPVLLKNGSQAIALSWTGYDQVPPAIEAFYELNRASQWQEFCRALSKYSGHPQMVLYCDRLGNAGAHAAGRVPLRRGNVEGTRPLPGWAGKGEWISRIAFDSLPLVYNPAQGFAVAANQHWPAQESLGHQFCPPYRAWRVSSLLREAARSGRKVHLPDLGEMQADQFACLGDLVRRQVRESIVNTTLIDKHQLAALDHLSHWNGQLSGDSPAAAIYETFIHVVGRRIVQGKLKGELADEYFSRWPMWVTLIEGFLRERQKEWLPPEERTYGTFILTSFVEALRQLKVGFHTDDIDQWYWKGAHQATFEHLVARGIPWLGTVFAIGPVGVGGDQDSLNACNAVPVSGNPGRFACKSAPSLRLLVDMFDQDKLYGSLSVGQSGQFFSPHREDQCKSWLKSDPFPVAFSDAQVDRQTEHKLYLTAGPAE